jgi:purine-binding chemotaxis protein CheW
MSETSGQAAANTQGQVLEFDLADETYCVSIDYVTEIVDVDELTEVPNAPPYVEGVMDLRGRTTSIVNPKNVFGIDGEGAEQRVIVFDPNIIANQAAAGWLVDEVYQVVQITADQVDASPSEGDDSIRGVVKRDDGFVIWVDPAMVHAA